MKTSILYTYIALMGMASAQEVCEEGKRVTISPGYTVEYRCNKFRLGQSYSNIVSHEDCAAKCQVGNVDVCTYHAAQKKCIVGDPNGREGTSSGATYMVRVPEEPVDPFPEEEEDPFKETCEEQRDDLRGKLEQCQAKLDAGATKPPTCKVRQIGKGYYKTRDYVHGGPAICKNLCEADPKCLSYSSQDGYTHCYFYDKETAEVPALNVNTGYFQYDKRCGKETTS